ncbi:phage tail protein [Brevibacillus composti]|uniref:Phage tail protein n=1 Tax=Brevibacillus composti TaxID=2796470 RepID=A0ABX7Z8Z3_9BACL|nr:phage tail protein [Brevibacillus composti]QUO43466.1 phage tail protein [Brevibacillus composti]
MSYQVTTAQARKDIARARLGEIPLPKITHIAFGTGGHRPGDVLTPVKPSETATSLEQEVARYPIVSAVLKNDTTVEYKTVIPKGELSGVVLTEQALVDENGKIVAIKTFGAKKKEAEDEFTFTWDEDF